MTSLQTNTTAITRSRSTRAPANPHKTIQTRGTTATASSASSTAGGAPTSHSPLSATNVSLFLTNLHLLDLDLHPDWPGINALTFTAKDAAHGQKKRIQCVEWALYQLFTLWDADEARNKLQPFFPPLDQVQSLNLRAALLRGLEQAKKNGVLGRDAVVRKTMLDECKGERLEEVLAVFSSAVLKKLVAEQQLNEPGHHPALAQSLALEHRGYSAERSELNALVLVHKAALSRSLQDKDAVRARFRDFSEVLDLKERSLARRREQAKVLESRERASRKGSISDDAKMDVWRVVRNNWSGNEQWMEALLYGDSNARQDGLLTTPFERVWRKVQSGRLTELEDQAGGLLEQLDRRVTTQTERLRKWEEFQARMFGKPGGKPGGKAIEPSGKQRGIDLGFGPHESLHIGRLSPRKAGPRVPQARVGEYATLVQDLNLELASLDRGRALARLPRAGRRGKTAEQTPEMPAEETISDISELDDEAATSAANVGKPTVSADLSYKLDSAIQKTKGINHSKPRMVEAHMVHRRQQSSSSSRRVQPVAAPLAPPPAREDVFVEPMRPKTPPSRSPTRRTPSPRKDSPPRHWNASPERIVSPTQLMADQILASMNAASPSPLKKQRHTLSLAERTRLSMARRGPQGVDVDDHDGDDEPDLHMPPPRTPTVTVDGPKSIPVPDVTPEDDDPEHEDLVARTRRSMAGFEVARQKAQLERRRSQRKSKKLTVSSNRRDGSSYFPSVDEEGDSTLLLAEELMNNDMDDPDAIFKSRPKIKTSPVGTPVKGWAD